MYWRKSHLPNENDRIRKYQNQNNVLKKVSHNSTNFAVIYVVFLVDMKSLIFFSGATASGLFVLNLTMS